MDARNIALLNKMNRIIKFRAWNNDSKKMTAPFSLLDIDNSKLIEGDYEIMQFTGLKDKSNPCKDIYEYDIVNKSGVVVGNKYENSNLLKYETNFLIQGFGTEDWEATNKEAMDRGCFYSERHASKDEVRELE